MWAHICIVCLLAWIFSANIWLSPAAPSAVSAFYAECLDKKIQFNAHIWTKSKFLGMSIGVHNIGQGKPHSRRLDPPSSPEFQYVNDPPAAPLQVACHVWNTTSITSSPSPMATAGWSRRSALLWSHISMCRPLIPTVLDCPPVQVDSDGAVGGAGRRVQHLLLQVGLQCQHCVSHQTFLWREEAQGHRWYFVRGGFNMMAWGLV